MAQVGVEGCANRFDVIPKNVKTTRRKYMFVEGLKGTPQIFVGVGKFGLGFQVGIGEGGPEASWLGLYVGD